MLWNDHSTLANLGEFQKSLDENTPHLVCITETWLKVYKTLNLKHSVLLEWLGQIK